MEDDPRTVQSLLVARMVRLNALVQGIVTGLVLGSAIFLATMWLVVKGGPVVGPHLALLGQFFWGYRVTVFGSFIGFGYGFVTGFCIGFLVTSAYNRIAGYREKRSPARS